MGGVETDDSLFRVPNCRNQPAVARTTLAASSVEILIHLPTQSDDQCDEGRCHEPGRAGVNQPPPRALWYGRAPQNRFAAKDGRHLVPPPWRAHADSAQG